MQRIYVKVVPVKGRGVFAGRDLPAGRLVEKAYAVEFPASEFPLIEQTAFKRFYFIRDASDGTEMGLLVLGKISLLNHSRNPNAKVTFIEERSGVLAVLQTVRDVRKDEEITIDYDAPLWFEYVE